jgi:hypothetical protein
MKKALLIGINYFGTQSELQGCINDMLNLRDMLKNHYGFLDENIVLLQDGDAGLGPITQLPTRDTILYHLDDLLKGVHPGDSLFLAYSGHGSSIRDYQLDESDGKDEVIIPQDWQTNGIISDDEIFTRLISLVPSAVRLTCFFDACHSGTVCDLKYNFRYAGALPSVSSTTNYSNNQNKYTVWQEHRKSVLAGGNVIMFSGCYDEQTSADAQIGNKNQGAFTYAMLRTLQSCNYNIKNKYLLKDVNCLLASLGFEQRSQLSCTYFSLFDSNFTM